MKNNAGIDHRPLFREGTEKKYAVLMIHGIVGSPAHFRTLYPAIPEDWTVHNLLLDGHGKGVSDFSCSSMEKWRAQVQAAMEALLSRHERVLVVAHSMGTLLALELALRYGERVPFLFLLAVPTRPCLRLSTALTGLRLALGLYGEGDKKAMDMLQDTSIRLEPRLWKYLGWIPRYLELFALVRRARRELLPGLGTPALCFQSRRDELVSFRSCRDLEQNPHIRLRVLEHSGHFQYGEADAARLRDALSREIDGLRGKE